jgi:hypothetical protein
MVQYQSRNSGCGFSSHLTVGDEHNGQVCTPELASVKSAHDRRFAMPLLGDVRVQCHRGTEFTVATARSLPGDQTRILPGHIPYASNQTAMHDARCMTASSAEHTRHTGLGEQGRILVDSIPPKVPLDLPSPV